MASTVYPPEANSVQRLSGYSAFEGGIIGSLNSGYSPDMIAGTATVDWSAAARVFGYQVDLFRQSGETRKELLVDLGRGPFEQRQAELVEDDQHDRGAALDPGGVARAVVGENLGLDRRAQAEQDDDHRQRDDQDPGEIADQFQPQPGDRKEHGDENRHARPHHGRRIEVEERLPDDDATRAPSTTALNGRPAGRFTSVIRNSIPVRTTGGTTAKKRISRTTSSRPAPSTESASGPEAIPWKSG